MYSLPIVVDVGSMSKPFSLFGLIVATPIPPPAFFGFLILKLCMDKKMYLKAVALHSFATDASFVERIGVTNTSILLLLLLLFP